MKVREIQVKSIITKSNLPDADYVINPYIGCAHGCIYCYARYMKRFTGHTEPWGEFVDVKINAAELVPQNSIKNSKKYTQKYKGKTIFLASVTDAYMPIERKYKITRKVLEKLIPLQPNLGVQTKSDLVTRDIDLFQQFKQCEVGITITTLNNDLQKEIEPFTSSISNRIKALEKLNVGNINTYIFIGPIMPYLTDWKEIILKTKHCTNLYMFENLNIRGSIWNSIQTWLKKKHPELLEKYNEIYFTKSNYWNNMEKEIKQFCKEQDVQSKIYFHHSKK